MYYFQAQIKALFIIHFSQILTIFFLIEYSLEFAKSHGFGF